MRCADPPDTRGEDTQMADTEKSLVRKIHDVTCPGALLNVKPMQRICPVCRSNQASE